MHQMFIFELKDKEVSKISLELLNGEPCKNPLNKDKNQFFLTNEFWDLEMANINSNSTTWIILILKNKPVFSNILAVAANISNPFDDSSQDDFERSQKGWFRELL